VSSFTISLPDRGTLTVAFRAVTAVYKGTNPKTGSSILLRSYDSRKEPPPEFNCTIWQAGRATSATGLAFKPIQIGQSVFIDEGAGKYNPAPQALEEAAVNEWPGRDIGVFVSVGTGKRPAGTGSGQHEWWEGFVGGAVGNFAEARRRLIGKIESCEDTHIQMVNVELAKRGVPLDNYYRLNVEVGVGELGMNEWDRLSDMTISTRRYLKKPDTQRLLEGASFKMAKIELMKRRHERQVHSRDPSRTGATSGGLPSTPPMPPSRPGAVELPTDGHQTSPPQAYRTLGYPPYPDGALTASQDKFVVLSGETPPPRQVSADLPYRSSTERVPYNPSQPPPRSAGSDYSYTSSEPPPPPRPPKTPITDTAPTGQHAATSRPNGHPRLPYPDTDGPPPIVSKLRKPEFSAR